MKTLIILLLFLKGSFGLTQQVVVANNRQNIVYYGVQNSLSALAAGYPCQSTVLTTDNGKIEKFGCSFTYQPIRIGVTKIKVWVKKGQKLKLVGFTMYRAKLLPLPVTLIGVSKGGYISSKVLKAQGGVRAYVPDSDLEVSVTVVSYTAIATRDTALLFKNENVGAAYNDSLSRNLDRLRAGDSFIIFNIICKGPYDKEVNLNPMEFYIKN